MDLNKHGLRHWIEGSHPLIRSAANGTIDNYIKRKYSYAPENIKVKRKQDGMKWANQMETLFKLKNNWGNAKYIYRKLYSKPGDIMQQMGWSSWSKIPFDTSNSNWVVLRMNTNLLKGIPVIVVENHYNISGPQSEREIILPISKLNLNRTPTSNGYIQVRKIDFMGVRKLPQFKWRFPWPR